MTKSMVIASAVAALLTCGQGKALLAIGSWWQAPEEHSRFEVASLKLSGTVDGTPGVAGRRIVDPGRFEVRGASLSALLLQAFGIKRYQLSGGGGWMEVAKYDIFATIPQDIPQSQVPAMLKALLENRLHLSAHSEKRLLSVYEVELAPGGLKVPEVPADAEHPCCAGSGSGGPSGEHIKGTLTIDALLGMVQFHADHPLVNLTGLKGQYRIDLFYLPDVQATPQRQGAMPAREVTQVEAPGPPLFDALLKQAGLKVTTRKALVETVVIDHVDRIPVEN